MTDIINQLQSTYFYFTVGGVEFQLQLLTAAALSLVLLLIALVILVAILGKSGKAKRKAEEEKKKETAAAVSGLKLSKSLGSAVKKGPPEDKHEEIVKKISEKTLDQIYAREQGLVICPFCETFNSQKNTSCCACDQPIRK